MRSMSRFLPFGIAAAMLITACSSDSDSSSDDSGDSSVTTSADSVTDESATDETTSDETASGETVAEPAVDDYYTVSFDAEETAGTIPAAQVGAETTTRTALLPTGDYEAVTSSVIADPSSVSLDGMVEGARASVNGDDATTETVTLNGWEGRQWSFTFDQAGTAGTYYAVGVSVDDKLLQVAYVDIGSDNADEAAAFVGSLEITTPGPG